MQTENKNMEDAAKEKDYISKHVKMAKAKIVKFLPRESPSDVLIIKSHLICEYYINQILILKDICSAKQINKLTFYDKLQKSFNLDDKDQRKMFERIERLNKLRNKVGHELEYILSESDVDNLGYIVGKEYILEKYDFETLSDLLRNTLLLLVIDLSFFVYEAVMLENRQNNQKS